MRLYPEQLVQHLEQGFSQTYLLFGNEPLLKIEAQDSIMQHAFEHGFLQRLSFQIDNQLNWDELYQECLSMGLFAEKKIITLSMPESGVNQSIIKALAKLQEFLHPDIILILMGNKLLKRQESAKWFTALLETGVYIPCNTPLPRFMPQFVMQRCQRIGLQPDSQSIDMLINYHEGNLLALKQSLEKLILVYPDGVLNLPRMQQALSRHNHFSPYQLIDTLLEEKPKRAVRILQELNAEGIEPVILLRSLQRELGILYSLKVTLTQHAETKKVFDSFNIWQNKRQLYINTVNRLPLRVFKHLIQQLSQLEISYKTDYEADLWPRLTGICIQIAGAQTKIDSYR